MRALAVLVVLVLLAMRGFHGWAVHFAPGAELTRADLEALLTSESAVLYRDGRTRVGVLFEDQHRLLIGWEEIPLPYVIAVVAVEDDRFWRHHGVDPVHVLRALRDNWEAGRVVSGGSTLTQQTAKNLFGRRTRTMGAKARELIHALQLEHRLSKEEIFSLYANQFHVTGNGRGLAIGARHFFDRDAGELTLVQASFLAGMLKAPARYDVFAAEDDERAAARGRAAERTRYVLSRVVAVPAEQLAGLPPQAAVGDARHEDWRARVGEVRSLQDQARALLAGNVDLQFRRGAFRFEPSVVVDEVALRLAAPPFDEVLRRAGVDDPATAGLRIVTTVDADAQRAATYGLWHHLTEVGALLEGLTIDDLLLTEPSPPDVDPGWSPRSRDVLVGRVVRGEGLTVDVGGALCRVDGEAVRRLARLLRTSPAAVRERLLEGGLVLASIREVRGEDARCDLELRPRLQGAAAVVRDGRLVAMVGGSDNRFFNRATAPRQMGSAWKPLVLHAALTLGWSPTDLVDNRLGRFTFSTTAYEPRRDHASSSFVSLAWMGARSENLAAVWLLYHLTDHLSQEETVRLARQVGLAPRSGEDRRAWTRRLAREGVAAVDEHEALSLRARQQVLEARGQRGGPVSLGDELPAETGGWLTAEPVDLEADFEPIYWGRDFRVLLGMRYVTMLAEQYGVRTALREVLSLPLGGTELTLEELAIVYDGMSSGEAWRHSGESLGIRVAHPEGPAMLIEEIRDREGRLLYAAGSHPVRIASEPVAAMTMDVLRNVVEEGTGRRARGLVQVGGAVLPLAGKTGTSDDNRNAVFVGFAPVVVGQSLAEVLTVAVYVGNDRNQPMVGRGLRLQGANGALPAWMGIVRGLADAGLLAPREAVAPPDGWSWIEPEGTVRVPVRRDDGLQTMDGGDATVLTRRQVSRVPSPPRESGQDDGGWGPEGPPTRSGAPSPESSLPALSARPAPGAAANAPALSRPPLVEVPAPEHGPVDPALREILRAAERALQRERRGEVQPQPTAGESPG